MLMTWSIESVLLGLISISLVKSYLVMSQFVLSLVTCVLHLVCLASKQNFHELISTAYLSVITGLFLSTCLRPLETLESVLVFSLLFIAVFIGICLVFASVEGTTWLFLHPDSFFALLSTIALHLPNKTIALTLALSWIVFNMAPVPIIAHSLALIWALIVMFVFYISDIPHLIFIVLLATIKISLIVFYILDGKFETQRIRAIELLIYFTSIIICAIIGISAMVFNQYLITVSLLLPILLLALYIIFSPEIPVVLPASDHPAELPRATASSTRMQAKIVWPRLKEV